MSLRTIIVIGLSLTCGLSAAVGVNNLRPAHSSKLAKPATTSIVVAAVNMPRGMMLTEEHLATRDWPKDLVPAGAITSIEDALDRAVLSPLVKDEPVLDAKIATRDSGRGMAPLIPKGMRAFTIHTPTVASGVAGFILPGNHVDVLLTVTRLSQNDGTGGGSTTTLLQDVEILAVDQRLDAPAANKVDPKELRSVTLLVNPDQAAKLSLAQTKGTLHLSLRNDSDDFAANTRPITMKELRFLEEIPTARNDGDLADMKAALTSGVNPQRRAEPIRIRTLRANSSGVVYVQPVE